jgi:DNA-binding response OmpR family regulator
VDRVVLLIDDFSALREQLRMSLEQEFTVLEAGDVEEARRLFMTYYVDVVVTDIMLGKESGITLAREFLAIRTLPVVGVSGSISTQVTGKAPGVFSGFVEKPFLARKLVAEIRRVIAATVDLDDITLG